jgi:hypothetical protein
VIRVVSTDEDEAYSIFESLNDRGKVLATADRIRSLFLRRADDEDRSAIVNAWDDIFDLKDNANVDDLLRAYWITKSGDAKARALHREVRKFLDEHTLTVTPRSLTDELRRASGVYSDLARSRSDDPEYRRGLSAIEDVGAKALYPPLLAAALVRRDEAGGPTADEKRFLNALLTLYVRHTVVGRRSNSDLEKWVFDIARRISVDRLAERLSLQAAVVEVVGRMPSDNEFKSDLAKVELRGRPAKYILREFERFWRSGETAVVPENVWLEHIYPQNPDAPWADHDRWIHRLGNLTLLQKRLNRDAQNFAYSIKRNEHYPKSTLELVQRLPQIDSWAAHDIEHRQVALSVDAPQIWPIPVLG